MSSKVLTETEKCNNAFHFVYDHYMQILHSIRLQYKKLLLAHGKMETIVFGNGGFMLDTTRFLEGCIIDPVLTIKYTVATQQFSISYQVHGKTKTVLYRDIILRNKYQSEVVRKYFTSYMDSDHKLY